MKGCLKPSYVCLVGCEPPVSPRKTVVFESTSLEQVFLADEWDRTPMEPARKLTYQDLLELKEIQRSLPRANQPADNLTGKSGSHYLSGVPIGLLPLLPNTPTQTGTPAAKSPPRSRTTTSPMSPSWASFTPNSQQCPLPTSPPFGGLDARLHPSSLSHLPPAQPQAPKQKPRFAFLPLLDSPADAHDRSRSPSPDPLDTDPPTPSLTNASLDSSPLSRASSCSPEPPFFQLPPPRSRPGYHDVDELSDTDGNILQTGLSSKLGNMHLKSPPVPPYGYNRPVLTRFVPPPPPPPPTTRRKAPSANVIVVNGIEIDLDDDDDDDDESLTPPGSSAAQQSRSPTVLKAPTIPMRTQSPPPPQKPVLRWQSQPNEATSTPSMGMHSPIRFKRPVAASPKGDSSSPISTSPPSPSRGRRGSCSSKARPHVTSPLSSPILMPRA